jgi:hypothetical protein
MIYHQRSSEREVSIIQLPDNKVKKSVFCYSQYNSAGSVKNRIKAFSHYLRWVKENPQNFMVNIYDYSVNFEENSYFYVMEFLKDLNKREEHLADDFFNYHNGNLSKSSERQYQSLVKTNYKLYQFLEENCGAYDDVHGGNIGIDKNGQYKFMDLEGSAWSFNIKQNDLIVKFKNKIIFEESSEAERRV